MLCLPIPSDGLQRQSFHRPAADNGHTDRRPPAARAGTETARMSEPTTNLPEVIERHAVNGCRRWAAWDAIELRDDPVPVGAGRR